MKKIPLFVLTLLSNFENRWEIVLNFVAFLVNLNLNHSQDAKSYLLYGLICIPFSHIYLAYCGRALQTKIQFYESLSISLHCVYYQIPVIFTLLPKLQLDVAHFLHLCENLLKISFF